jgi:hypothetical protein
MNYFSILIALGITVVLIPNLGFPGSWKIGLLSCIGVAISTLAYFASREVVTETDVKSESVLPE